MIINGFEFRYIERNVTRHGAVRFYFRTPETGRIRMPDPEFSFEAFKAAYREASTHLPENKIRPSARRKQRPQKPLPTCDPRITVKMFQRVIAGCRARAKRKGLEFELNESWAHAMFIAQDGRCAVTGVPMIVTQPGNGKSPYQLSVDRRDSNQGYTEDNCRLVSLAANFAMNIWGEDIFKEIWNRSDHF